MKRGAKLGIAAAALTGVVGLLALANYVAGVVLFSAYKQDPTAAQFTTIQQAWRVAESPLQKRKLKISALVALLACLGGPGLVLQLLMRTKPPSPHGDARFATRLDIRKEGLDQPVGLLLGRLEEQLLRLPGNEFVLLAAPTRTGKGVGFCVPNLLDFPDSAVVLDIKGENYNLTSAYRQQQLGNEVFYFNPFSETTARWNPLSYVSSDPNFRGGDLKALAAIIYPSNSKDPFWSDAASNLFVGLALLVLETPALPQTLGEVMRQASAKGRGINEYLSHVIAVRQASSLPLSSACTASLNGFLDHPETTLKNILSTFAAPLGAWRSNAVLDKATSANDFDLRELRKRKMTVFVHVPAHQIMQANFVLNLFFSQVISENVRELPEENPDLKHQCLILMDEFTAMGKVSIIAKGIGYMAGYNLRLAIVIQDRSQLEAAYGREDAHGIVSNMGAMIVFTPSQVREAEEYSKLIGNQTINTKSQQRSNIGAMSAGSSSRGESEAPHARALMLPQELLRMDRTLSLVVRSGMPVIQARKIQYFADKSFTERLDAVASREVTVADQPRRVPCPLPMPGANWAAYKGDLTRTDYYLHGDFSDLPAPEGGPERAVATGALSELSQSTTPGQTGLAAQFAESTRIAHFAALFAGSRESSAEVER